MKSVFKRLEHSKQVIEVPACRFGSTRVLPIVGLDSLSRFFRGIGSNRLHIACALWLWLEVGYLAFTGHSPAAILNLSVAEH